MPQRRQVTAPEPLNHHATGRAQSCMTCHDGKRERSAAMIFMQSVEV